MVDNVIPLFERLGWEFNTQAEICLAGKKKTFFDAKMLKGGNQEKRYQKEECKMEKAGGLDPFPPKIECN